MLVYLGKLGSMYRVWMKEIKCKFSILTKLRWLMSYGLDYELNFLVVSWFVQQEASKCWRLLNREKDNLQNLVQCWKILNLKNMGRKIM